MRSIPPAVPRSGENMDRMDCFAVKVALSGDRILSVGGLCGPGNTEKIAARCRTLEAFRCIEDDVVDIDRALAAALDAFADDGVFVMGATFFCRLQNAVFTANGWRTGGVIGVPGVSSEDAAGTLEHLPNGLYLYAAPGGPGFAAAVARGDAEILMGLAQAGEPGPLLKALKACASSGYLCVFDGMGPSAAGLLAVGAGGHQFYLDLHET